MGGLTYSCVLNWYSELIQPTVHLAKFLMGWTVCYVGEAPTKTTPWTDLLPNVPRV